MDKTEPQSDTLYQAYDRNLYKASPDPEGDIINDMLNGYGNSNATVNNSMGVTMDPATMGSGVFNNTGQQAVGTMQSGKTTFNNTQTGYIMGFDPKDGFAKFYIGNSTQYLNWTGSSLVISGNITATTGAIGGFTIGADYIEDAANSMGLSSTVTSGNDVRFWAGDTFANRATAPFHVFENGDATVNSLERNDFHFFTMFESLDGYSKTFVGLGTVVLGYQYWTATTGINNNDNCVIVKEPNATSVSWSWDKKRKIKLAINPQSGNAGFTGLIGSGECSGATNRHIGFYLSGSSGTTYSLNTSVCDGSSTTTASLGTFNFGTYKTVEARWFPASKVEYYVDGVLTATVTTSLPSGTTDANRMFNCYLTSGGGAQALQVAYYDFWQAN